MKAGKFMLVALIGAMWLFASACSAGSMQPTPTPLPVVVDLTGITAEARLEPIRFVSLAPAAEGLVSEVLVAEGEQVEAGQLIARLDGTEILTLDAARTKAAVDLGNAYQDLRRAQEDLDEYPIPRIFVGMSAEEAARKWLSQLDAANVAFAPYKGTSRKTLKSRDAFSWWVYPSLPRRVVYDTGEYDDVAMVYKKQVDVARTNYTKAVMWLQLDSKVESAKARLDDAQRRYDSLQAVAATDTDTTVRAALAAAEIRAPFAGTVTNIDLKVGEIAQAGKAVATLADFSKWVVKTTNLTEIDVVGIGPGRDVSLVFDAMPNSTFGGTVLSVDLGYADRQGDVVYPTTILLTETDPALRWGMTAEVTFEE